MHLINLEQNLKTPVSRVFNFDTNSHSFLKLFTMRSKKSFLINFFLFLLMLLKITNGSKMLEEYSENVKFRLFRPQFPIDLVSPIYSSFNISMEAQGCPKHSKSEF